VRLRFGDHFGLVVVIAVGSPPPTRGDQACGRRRRGTVRSGQAAQVSRPAHRPDVLRGRVFRGTWAVSEGLLTRNQLRSSAWRRLREDVHADARQPGTHRLHARAAGLVMPRGAALGGRTAAVLCGLADAAGPADPVEVVLPPRLRWCTGRSCSSHGCAPSWGDHLGRVVVMGAG
jgi:hypothetical protein